MRGLLCSARSFTTAIFTEAREHHPVKEVIDRNDPALGQYPGVITQRLLELAPLQFADQVDLPVFEHLEVSVGERWEVPFFWHVYPLSLLL